MAPWHEIETAAPEFAQQVRRRFDLGTNKTIATLRRGGAPRISACELQFVDGEVTLGMMGGSMKPPTEDTADWLGDAKLSGRVTEVAAPGDNTHEGAGFFQVDICDVALTYAGTPADHLVIESWHQGRGWQRRTRS